MAAVGGGGGGQSAGGIRAGMAFVELVAKDKIGPVLDKVQKKFAGLGSALTKAGGASLAAGASVLAPVVALAAAGADRFDKMANEAKRLDIPIDQFYRLSTAADIAGVSIEQLAEAPQKYRDAFAKVSEAPVEDIKAAAAASMEWRATLIALKDAAAGVMTSLVPTFKAVASFVRENKGAVKVVALVGAGLAALGVAGIATGAAFNVLAAGVTVIKGIMFGVVVGAKLLVGALLAMKAVLTASITLMPLLTGAFSGALAVFAAMKVAVLAILSPMGLVTAAIVALGALFLSQVVSFDGAIEALKGLFRDLGQTFADTYGGIVAAVKKGDLEQAFKVACAGVKVAWVTLLEFMTRKWFDFVKSFESGRSEWVDQLARVMTLPQVFWTRVTQGEQAARDQVKLLNANFEEMARHEARQREQIGAAQIAAAQAELDAARAALRREVEAANQPGGRIQNMPNLPAPAAGMMGRVQGAFYGPLSQQLGAGSQWNRDVLAALRQIPPAVQRVERAVENAGAVFT